MSFDCAWDLSQDKMFSIIIWGWHRSKEDTFHKSLRLLVMTTFAHRLFLMIIQIFYWCLRPKIKYSNYKNSAFYLYSTSCLNELDFIRILSLLNLKRWSNWLNTFSKRCLKMLLKLKEHLISFKCLHKR